MEKKKARRIVQRKIARLTKKERSEKAKAIGKRLFSLSEFQKGQVIMFFAGMADEVDTREMMVRALNEGKTVALPRTHIKSGSLRAFEIKSLVELVPGTYGILEPPETLPIAPASIDFIVVPARAYDRRGNRLGREKAFMIVFWQRKI